MYSFYVDDLLQSYLSEELATTMVHELIACTRRGSFHLTKWMSNSRSVLDSLPPSEISPKLTFELESSNIELALGILWDINSDILMFAFNSKEVDATKRGMLKIMASIFDPPGYVTPSVLIPKLPIQEAWRLGSDWDAKLNPDMEK